MKIINHKLWNMVVSFDKIVNIFYFYRFRAQTYNL